MDVNWQHNNPPNPADAAIGPMGYDNHLYYSFGVSLCSILLCYSCFSWFKVQTYVLTFMAIGCRGRERAGIYDIDLQPPSSRERCCSRQYTTMVWRVGTPHAVQRLRRVPFQVG